MNWFTLSLLFHLIGVGMIFTLLFAGPIIESNFRWENDVRMKQHAAKLLRSIGLLSPFGALLLVISGIGNMVALQIKFTDLFGKASWLGLKLIAFLILLIMGAAISPKAARRRAAILEQMNQPDSPDDIQEKLSILNKKQVNIFAVNWILVVIILVLTLLKP